MPIQYEYIRKQLEPFEGKGVTQAYVPCRQGVVLGVSGVTIGTGVDLGQQTDLGLAKMGVGLIVVLKLMPYLGLKKQQAVAFLKANPLQLSRAEVENLDTAVINHYINNTARQYNQAGPAAPFENIPKQAQAVIVSLFYQKGGPKTFPHTWQALLNGNWANAANRLRTPALWTDYHSRRKAEGGLLLEIKA